MTSFKDRAEQLENRMMDLSLAVISVSKKAPKSQENNIITAQLIRSATSIGANYTEANNAASKQDFRNKIFISKKEAAETWYWLRLLSKSNPTIEVKEVLDEVSQILFILQKIITTLKHSKNVK